jgi:hypothetical protein
VHLGHNAGGAEQSQLGCTGAPGQVQVQLCHSAEGELSLLTAEVSCCQLHRVQHVQLITNSVTVLRSCHGSWPAAAAAQPYAQWFVHQDRLALVRDLVSRLMLPKQHHLSSSAGSCTIGSCCPCSSTHGISYHKITNTRANAYPSDFQESFALQPVQLWLLLLCLPLHRMRTCN